ncbi:MAG: 2-hydroxyacyl-CoA dehydratase [Candidatus Lokiarchaeota archaeon]|nr:2-hydroxyacyl-CoA dehydratase [Candidatus Lokiarchaeota archaeon]
MKIGILDSGVETPEEIIMAAEMTPVRLLSNPLIELSKSNEHVPPNHCIWARNILEQALQAIDDDIKGIVVAHGCDCTNREFDIWLECVHLDFMYFLNAPLKRDEIALKFFIDDIKEMISQIEEKFDVSINSEKIRKAIILTNKIRRILKEMSEYRAKRVLKTSQFHAYVKKVQQQDKTEMLMFLEKELERVQHEKTPNSLQKPILLTGSVIDDTNFIVYLENLGFDIITDDLCIGTRYFWNLIDETCDPIEALARYHLEKPIYSTKSPSIERFTFLKYLAETYKVKGVINVAQKFCEPVLFDHPIMSTKFKELGIPYLFIELEYKQESYKQLSTRFEAFGEIL